MARSSGLHTFPEEGRSQSTGVQRQATVEVENDTFSDVELKLIRLKRRVMGPMNRVLGR
jgi:hypothetical protein